MKTQAESLHDFGKREPHVQDVALQDLDDAGDLQREIRKYDPRQDERDMVRLGKTQELKVSHLKKIAIRVWLSNGRYHREMIRIAPGKKPAVVQVLAR